MTPHIVGLGNTRFGRIAGSDPIGLMAQAAEAALADAGIDRGVIDGLLCGYATTLPHLMLANLFAERFSLAPANAASLALGGATGAALVMTAGDLIRGGRCRTILVVAGENRLTGQTRDQSIAALGQVGDAEQEAGNGASVPAFYALLAARYLHETGAREEDLADLAVLMRRHAEAHPDAHLREPIAVADVMASKPIATPLKLLDCCPISDGAVAFVVSADCGSGPRIALAGAGQAHRHQHVSALADIQRTGAGEAAAAAFSGARIDRSKIDHLGIYDSFSITLAMLIEETGFAPRGQSGRLARDGAFGRGGLPLNMHGGLLSFGHSGVAGGMAHIAEAVRQLRGEAGARQAGSPACAFVHADGGILSAHVSLVLERRG